ncbi:MAG: serine hydrolase domain-containing protein, partial [Longimicrobiales bacterium]
AGPGAPVPVPAPDAVTAADAEPPPPLLGTPVAEPPPARLPLVEPGDVNMSPLMLDRVDNLVWAAVREGVSPGIALAIGRHGKLVRLAGYRRTDWVPSRMGPGLPDVDLPPYVSDSTLYDLASLTKVIATTTAAMLLYDDGVLDLDVPVYTLLPDFARSESRDQITVRHLLTHSAGLPAWRPFFAEPLLGKAAHFHRIASIALEYEPGTRTVYSDLGMILLHAVVERLSGRPINELLQQRVFGPLGMRDTYYSPLQGPAPSVLAEYRGAADEGGSGEPPHTIDLMRIAPTEYDARRERLIHGYVHDENAFAMGGVAGHAGLFSSARDLAVFAQMMLDRGVYDGRRIIREETVRHFTQRQSSRSSRALGWDTPAPASSAGDYFSSASFGHTGFTGTSLWIDPERDLFVVLLTNRVNPTRENQRHVPFRRSLHDLVQQAVTDVPIVPRLDSRR